MGGAIGDLPADVTEVSWPLPESLLTFGDPQPGAADFVVRCAVVSADEASEVADALEKAGAALHTPLGETWATRSDLGERATTRVIGVIFVALHPHENDCVDASPP